MSFTSLLPRTNFLSTGLRLYSSLIKKGKSEKIPKPHKLSHIALGQASYTKFIKENFMVKGQYLRYLDNARNKLKEDKLERRASILEFRNEFKVTKSFSHQPRNTDFKRENLKSRISSAIEDIVAMGISPCALIHPLNWKVNSITVNNDATSAFIRWSAIENSKFTKLDIEKAVRESIPVLRKLILKEMGPRNRIRLAFSDRSDEPEVIENLFKEVEKDLIQEFEKDGILKA
ncbi:hypothetical protein DSO57_1027342 [Entomophthora muscae]|uniref:Uncharacterized protein n=1 Tax=Entomophthora muscae TaxID=34485 RepID=A0ACC2U0E3_9FUNG|nr:hypothetical protein DSO57_1027342 [Entomophthora muscae]